MDERLVHLLLQQQRSGFADLAGARLVTTIPMTERFLNEAIASYLPSGGPIQELQLSARPDDQLSVRVTLTKPRFLPPLTMKVTIERQPELPASPSLVLRLAGGAGMMSLAGPALAMLDVWPKGIHMEGDRIHVNLQVLLEQRGLGIWMSYLDRVHVTTGEGTVILSIDARILPPPSIAAY